MKKIFKISIIMLALSASLFAQGPQGTALDFGSSNDSLYVLVQDDVSLDATTAVTLEAWVYFRSATGSWNVIVEKAYDEYGMYVRSYGVVNFYTTGTFGTISLDGTTVLDTTTWYHLSATYDSTSGTANVYVNGHLDGTRSGYPGVIDTTLRPLRIGDDRENDTAFDGIIDEVRVWNIARDSVEIQATMNRVLGTEYFSTPDSGLIGYWRFDETEGDTAYDLSGYGNHGEIRGAVFTDGTAPLNLVNNTEVLPGEFQLLQNYPNPFNPQTTINFYLPAAKPVDLAIFNILGQRVRGLIHQVKMAAGTHSINWNGNTDQGINLPSGMYISALTVEGQIKTRKLILVR